MDHQPVVRALHKGQYREARLWCLRVPDKGRDDGTAISEHSKANTGDAVA